MNVRFTLQDMRDYALNETRWYEFYDMARSYHGVQRGEYWSTQDCVEWILNSGDMVIYQKEGYQSDHGFVSRGGIEFDLDIVVHASKVLIAMAELEFTLKCVHRREGEFATIKLAKRTLCDLLRDTEL